MLQQLPFSKSVHAACPRGAATTKMTIDDAARGLCRAP